MTYHCCPAQVVRVIPCFDNQVWLYKELDDKSPVYKSGDVKKTAIILLCATNLKGRKRYLLLFDSSTCYWINADYAIPA